LKKKRIEDQYIDLHGKQEKLVRNEKEKVIITNINLFIFILDGNQLANNIF